MPKVSGEAMHTNAQTHLEPQITRRDLAIAVWEALDCESVGAKELEQIQSSVAERFGKNAVDSPAALARILANEGAHLRHPEVLEADARWRQRKLLDGSVKVELKFLNLTTAAASMAELENSRRKFAQAHDEQSLRELREVVLRHKQDRQLIATSALPPEVERTQAGEIVGWLDVWLRTPALFADWLELRRAAPEFRQRFESGSESDKL